MLDLKFFKLFLFKPFMNKYYSLLARYLVLVLVAIPNLWLFYLIFTPFTVYPVYFLLDIFFAVSLTKTTLFLGIDTIKIISACVAGSAYYLLLILNLTTPNIKKRAQSIFFAFSLLLLVNILRIVLFAVLFHYRAPFFNFTHQLSWYFLSIIFVIAIWFYEVKLFKIKDIPIYTDIKLLIQQSQ